MKTVTVQTFAIAVVLAFILAASPAVAFAADQGVESGHQDNVDHITLAQHYKQQAEECQAKLEDEIEAVKNKPRSAYLGKNAKNFKRHVAHKLHNLEEAVAENLEKADYHESMAAEQLHQPVSVLSNSPANTKG